MITSGATNTTVALSALKNLFLNADDKSMIALFTGTTPDIDKAGTLFTSGNSVTCADVMASMGVTSSQCLGCMRLPVPTSNITENSIHIFLSGMSRLLAATQSGTPTFAIIRGSVDVATTDTYASFNSTSVAGEVLIVSVGDEKSNADIQILGGTMTSGQQYRLSDLILNIL